MTAVDHASFAPAGKGPVFIGGLAHSGKTPLRIMLQAHPSFSMSRRTYLWTRFYRRFGDLSRPGHFERCLAALLAHKPIQQLHPDPHRLRREFRQGRPTYARLFALVHQHHAERLGRPRWGDQLGWVERFAEPIFAAYPGARIIHMVRDPRDRYAISAARSGRAPGGAGLATARWLHSVFWMKRNQQRYAARYKVVQHEMLARQTEATLREICTFLGEDFVPQMLSAYRLAHPDEAAEPGREATREPPGLSAGEWAFTQRYAGESMQAIGYSLTWPRLSLRERLRAHTWDWAANRVSMAAWNAWIACRR